MGNKINVSELLKNCPQGMELDYVMYEDVYFDYVDELNIIHCYIKNEGFNTSITFNQHGTPHSDAKSKCVISPKGKTTWEGFVPPIKFKDGDVVISTSNNIHLISCRDKNNGWESCCSIIYGKFDSTKTVHVIPTRFATEEEKAKLFQAIKDSGYRWNTKTKTLEKLPRFKVGDRIKSIHNTYQYDIKELTDTHYTLVEVEEKFKYTVPIVDDKDWELVPDKFDITTLKPFESRVLVRDTNAEKWKSNFWGFYDIDDTINYPYECCGSAFAQCIPYEGNEHLLGTTNDCYDFYKTWEK